MKNNLSIPKSFWIFGQQIHVIYDENLLKDFEAYGLWLPGSNKIVLQPDCQHSKRTKAQVEQTYLHELVHCILHFLSEDKLNSSEKFVDLVAQSLHQIFQSSNYAKK